MLAPCLAWKSKGCDRKLSKKSCKPDSARLFAIPCKLSRKAQGLCHLLLLLGLPYSEFMHLNFHHPTLYVVSAQEAGYREGEYEPKCVLTPFSLFGVELLSNLAKMCSLYVPESLLLC